MRDGMLSVAEDGACPSLSLLRVLKREFGFYCIEMSTEVEAKKEVVYLIGGTSDDVDRPLRMDLYGASGQWSTAAAIDVVEHSACSVSGNLFIIGGIHGNYPLSSVLKYATPSDPWSAVAALPEARSDHGAVAVESDIYVPGWKVNDGPTASVLKFDSVADT
jgi:hypothetical protein